MSYTPHVNGPALIRIGKQGNSATRGDALSDVGYTEAGPQIAIDFNTEDVIADIGGPHVPADVQRFGKTAKINMQLVVYDSTVFQARMLKDGAEAEGLNGPTGQFIFANDLGFRIIITSPIDALVWRFWYCFMESASIKPGSKYNIWDVGIRAIPWPGPTTYSGGLPTGNWQDTLQNVPLFDHVNA
jgi:hypothetical protein